MKKYKEIENWINEEIPKLKKEFNIHVGRKARYQAENVAYLIGKSFLKHINSVIGTNHIQSANIKIESYIYYRAYEESLRCESNKKYKINIVAKENEPKYKDKHLERIINILLGDG